MGPALVDGVTQEPIESAQSTLHADAGFDHQRPLLFCRAQEAATRAAGNLTVDAIGVVDEEPFAFEGEEDAGETERRGHVIWSAALYRRFFLCMVQRNRGRKEKQKRR